MEYKKEAIRRILALQPVAGLLQKMRNIDDGERIGTFDDQTIAMRQQAEHLASPQRRYGTVLTAQIERRRGKSKNHLWWL